MSLDPRFIADLSLQQYLVDKDSGFPLIGGKVFFYKDNDRAIPKSVYQLTGDAPNYSFSPLPNPITLSSVGTMQDNNDNDIIPYYLPIVSLDDNTTDLYYVVVESATGVRQFTRGAWPPNATEPGGITPADQNDLFNFIPNGQFLTHNNIHPDNELAHDTNVIAPGGWTFELDPSSASTNFLIFNEITSWTPNPPKSPKFEAVISCTIPDPLDPIKSIRIKFNDVNKFASESEFFTFGFSGKSNFSPIDVTVRLIKDFGIGGSSFTPEPLATFTLTNEYQFFNVASIFGSNAGETIGIGQTFIALELEFPVNAAFNVSVTDFVLIQGNIALETFPTQTNADMLTRSVAGWMNVPDYSGQDLYLPLVLTLGGMQFDHSIIGKIWPSVGTVFLPSDPSALGNDMPCDGASYIYDDFSALGIPFSRLGSYLTESSPVPNTPLYGTGDDYATAYVDNGNLESFRLSVNSSGTGIPAASDGDTGWTFSGIVEYGGSTTGSNYIGYVAYNNVADTFLAVSGPEAVTAALAGTSGFTITDVGGTNASPPISGVNPLEAPNGLLAFHNYAFTGLCVGAAALSAPAAPGKYFTFSSDTTNYYMWFSTGVGETDPAPGGTGIEVTLQLTDTAQDVANIVREVMNAYQESLIVVTSPIDITLSGKYWNFSSNPASLRNFYVWYTFDTVGIDPSPINRTGIQVDLVTGDDEESTVIKTLAAINKYQYAAPDFIGMFLRGIDFDGNWDFDVAQRWSTVTGLSGANLGTFEYDQFLSHSHATRLVRALAGNVNSNLHDGDNNVIDAPFYPSTKSGGTETRPVNAYVNFVIKY